MSDLLQRVILEIEARLASVEEAFGEQDWKSPKASEAFAARRSAYQGIVDDLVTRQCAKSSFTGGAYTLAIGGIRASCTSGHHGLLTAWVRKARIEIAKAASPAAGKAVS